MRRLDKRMRLWFFCRLLVDDAVLAFDGGRSAVVAGGGAGGADFLGHGVEREALGAGDEVKSFKEAA